VAKLADALLSGHSPTQRHGNFSPFLGVRHHLSPYQMDRSYQNPLDQQVLYLSFAAVLLHTQRKNYKRKKK